MDVDTKMYSTIATAEAAGCKAGTFRSWRARNDLFPETKDAGVWPKFSFFDVCVVRLVQVLVEQGLEPSDAVQFASNRERLGTCARQLHDIAAGKRVAPVVGFIKAAVVTPDDEILDGRTGEVFRRGDRPPPRITFIFASMGWTLGTLLGKTTGAATLVDLRTIVAHVKTRLGIVED